MSPEAAELAYGRILRSAIDRAYPPEEDEDGDPVGEAPRWVIELTNGKEWVRVPVGKNGGLFDSKEEAEAFCAGVPHARVRFTGDE